MDDRTQAQSSDETSIGHHMIAARYTPNTAKTLEVILWLAAARQGIDLHHIVKAAFFADEYHLNKYGRPISGDEYQANRYGPLGECIYGLLTESPLERLALESNGPLPFTMSEAWHVSPTREPNKQLLSESDVEALTYGLAQVIGKSFSQLVQETNNNKAYVEANGGRMRYEDLLNDDDPQRDQKAADLVETARNAVF